MPWRSLSRLRSEPGAAARQAPFAGGRLLTVMMLRGYYRPRPAVRPAGSVAARTTAPLGLLPVGQFPVLFVQSTARRTGSKPRRCWGWHPAVRQKGVDCPMSRRADEGLEGPAGGERTAGSDRAEASAAVLRRHKAKRRRRSATGFRVAFALKDF